MPDGRPHPGWRPEAPRRGVGGEEMIRHPTFGETHKLVLDDATAKEGLKLFWFATGRDDFLVATTRATVEMFKKHQSNVTYEETDGAHTWDKWREYLREFAPRLFR